MDRRHPRSATRPVSPRCSKRRASATTRSPRGASCARQSATRTAASRRASMRRSAGCPSSSPGSRITHTPASLLATYGVAMRSMETRLGIVLYGGVSLAVYENGVAQELFRAVRDSTTPTVYDLVKDMTDSDVVVDVISGTSAGGINGIFLGYALANGRDFSVCADLWRESGDILALLHKPSTDDVHSVLDSQGFYQTKLEDAFRRMDAAAVDASGTPFTPSSSEIDLFVTGTDVHGRVWTEFDDQGHPIDLKDHRALFVLSYRPDRKNEFDRSYGPALAKLARITSCFPVAFEPVHVDYSGRRPNKTPQTDDHLQRWGQLTHEAYFLDGGVLDNKPFSYAISAIGGRSAERETERFLLYVEPDPERFTDEARKADGSDKTGVAMPSVIEAATDALIGIPGYESIADDLRSIAEHNARLAAYNEVRDAISELPALKSMPDDIEGTAAADDQSVFGDLSDPRVSVYVTMRLSQLRERALKGLLKADGQVRHLNDAERRAARVLTQSFNAWPGNGVETLLDFDVYYRLRRLRHTVESIRETLYPASTETKSAWAQKAQPGAVGRDLAMNITSVWRRLNHQVKLLEMVQFAMETALDYSGIKLSDFQSKTPDPNDAQQIWLR